MVDEDRGRDRRRWTGGPPLAWLAGVSTALFLLSVIVSLAMVGALPSPFASADTIVDYGDADADDAVRVAGFLQLGSAVTLAVLAATVSTRLRQLGVRVPGPTIGLAGGVLSAGLLIVSVLVRWPLADGDVLAQPAVVGALHDASFAAGGPGSVVPFGLLIAGLSIPAAFMGLLPRWVVATGLVLAGVAVLSSLTLMWEPAAYLLPMARFGGLLWLIVAGALLAPPAPGIADDGPPVSRMR